MIFVQLKNYNGMLYSFTDPTVVGTMVLGSGVTPPPQHGLSPNKIALITSYCGAMRTHEHQMALITSEYVPADFAGVPREDGRGGHTAGLVTHLRTIDHGAPTRAHRCGTKEMACRQTRQGGGSISLVARAPQFVPD